MDFVGMDFVGMDFVGLVVGVVALLGSGLVGGIFFAFSSFVMTALAKVSDVQGLVAMQSINAVVLNRSFLGSFLGTAVVSLGAILLAVVGWGSPAAPFWLGGALMYLLGTFLVTMFGNVPLNQQLEVVSAGSAEAGVVWRRYVRRWTLWNHVRTAAAMAAALLFSLGLLQHGVV